MPSTEATATNVEVFLNVEFQTEGTHWVEVLLDGDLKVRYPLRVGIVQKGQGQGAPPNMPPEVGS